MSSSISVIIPTYQRSDLLERCLDTLAHSFGTSGFPDDVQVIVSDDAEGLPSKEIFGERFDFVEWVQGPSRGPAANRNAGAAVARGEWLVFLDDDCEPQEGWIDAYRIGMRDAKVCEGSTFAERERERFNEESPVNLEGGFLWSCNFAIRAVVFRDLRGFDESFPFAAMEDVDLRERIKLCEASISFVPEAKVLHRWRAVRSTRMEKQRLLSHDVYWKKHPHLEPRSRFTFFASRLLRRVAKETVPGMIRYRCRGLGYQISKDYVLALWTLKHLGR